MSPNYHQSNFDQFVSSKITVSPEQAADICRMTANDFPGSQSVLCYTSVSGLECWIEDHGHCFYLIIERSEYESQDLATLEKLLYEWLLSECGEEESSYYWREQENS